MPVLLLSSLGTLLAPSKAESSRGAVWQTILQARNGVAGSLSLQQMMRGVKLVRSPRHRVMLSFVRSPGSFPDCFDTFSPRRHHFPVQASEEESEEEEVKVQRRLGLFLRPSFLLARQSNSSRSGWFFTTPLLQERGKPLWWTQKNAAQRVL